MTYVLVADKRVKFIAGVPWALTVNRQVTKTQLKIMTRRVEYPNGGHFLY